MKNIKWSIQLYKKLEKLVQKGLSATQIAIEMGVTKNTVIGKIHRSPNLRLERSRSSLPNKPSKTKREKLKFNDSLLPTLPMFSPPDPPMPFMLPMPHIMEPTVVFTGKPVKFADTNRFMCKYVVSGDKADNYLFCGDRVYKRSFCKHHFNICYTTVRYASLTA